MRKDIEPITTVTPERRRKQAFIVAGILVVLFAFFWALESFIPWE